MAACKVSFYLILLTGDKDSFINVKFEMNALDIAADNSIRLLVNVKPLRITYNAVSDVTTVSSVCICVCLSVCLLVYPLVLYLHAYVCCVYHQYAQINNKVASLQWQILHHVRYSVRKLCS